MNRPLTVTSGIPGFPLSKPSPKYAAAIVPNDAEKEKMFENQGEAFRVPDTVVTVIR
jgi:hypothetical protein